MTEQGSDREMFREEEEVKSRLALALMALDDIGEAELYAREEGLPLDRESCLGQIRALLGDDAADVARQRWAAQDKEDEERLQRWMKGAEVGMRFAAMDRSLEKFQKAWRWTAEQLSALLNPPVGAWSAAPVFVGRGRNAEGMANEKPIAVPLVDCADGKLFVSLKFHSGVRIVPEKKGQVQIFIDGSEVEVSEVKVSEIESAKVVDLIVPVTIACSGLLSEMDCEIHSNPDDPKRIAVVLSTRRSGSSEARVGN